MLPGVLPASLVNYILHLWAEAIEVMAGEMSTQSTMLYLVVLDCRGLIILSIISIFTFYFYFVLDGFFLSSVLLPMKLMKVMTIQMLR